MIATCRHSANGVQGYLLTFSEMIVPSEVLDVKNYDRYHSENGVVKRFDGVVSRCFMLK